MYEVILTDSYRKKAVKFIRQHPELKKRYINTFRLLAADPFNSTLDPKKMNGHENRYRIKLSHHSRIVLEIIVSEHRIISISIGTREDIY